MLLLTSLHAVSEIEYSNGSGHWDGIRSHICHKNLFCVFFRVFFFFFFVGRVRESRSPFRLSQGSALLSGGLLK